MSQPNFVDALRVEAANLRARLTVIEGVIALYTPADDGNLPITLKPPKPAQPETPTELAPNVIAKRYDSKVWAIKRQAQLEKAGIRSSINFTGGAWEVRPVA